MKITGFTTLINMKKKEHTCKCHKKIGSSITCNMECLKCSGAKEVKTTVTKDYKKIEISF